MKKMMWLLLAVFCMALAYGTLDDGNSTASAPIQPVSTESIAPMVVVQRSDGKVTIDLETYLIGVVAGEMPVTFPLEALKAQAIAARTFVASRKYRVDDSTKTQVYYDDEQLRNKWKGNYEDYHAKIKQAVDETRGQVLMFDDELARTLFYSSSCGNTASSQEYYTATIPYLQSVSSPWDEEECKNFETVKDIKRSVVIEQLGSDEIRVTERYASGYVKTVQAGSKRWSGKEVREKLGLKSSCFTVESDGDVLRFTTRGSGHGVGMSQYGAKGMAKKGYTADQILEHYYPGTEIRNLYE